MKVVLDKVNTFYKKSYLLLFDLFDFFYFTFRTFEFLYFQKLNYKIYNIGAYIYSMGGEEGDDPLQRGENENF